MTMSITTTKRLRQRLNIFARNNTGATAIEYALIAGGLSIAIILSVDDLGSTLADFYQDIAAAL